MGTDEDSVRAVLAEFDDAWDRGDLDAVLALCADDVVFIGSGEGEEAHGRDDIPAMLTRLGAVAEGLQFGVTYDRVDVTVLGEVALVVAAGTSRLTTPSQSRTSRYRLTGVLVRHGPGWLWQSHHGSEALPW